MSEESPIRRRITPPPHLAALISRLERLSKEELLASLQDQLMKTADAWNLLAAHVFILIQRGEALAELFDAGTFDLLKRIACGQLLADVVVKWGHCGDLFHRVKTLPLDEQQKLLSDGKVDVFHKGPDGNPDTLHIPLENLTRREVQKVFGPHIRTIAEQAQWERDQEQRKPAAPPAKERIVYCGNRKEVDLQGRFKKRELQSIMAGLK